MGAGPIGLLTLQCARLAGARTVTVTEVDPTRAALAARLGATAVLDPAREHVGVALAGLTDGYGPDLVYICTGAPAPYSQAFRWCARAARFSSSACAWNR
jgi:threonine dehydrogenase-like Zn-dependent dehydrogenase